MTCPLCRQRRAKRACPALGHSICTVCCGTQRLREIDCPSSCPHLAAARAHPPVASRRQHDADIQALMGGTGRLSQGQLQLFFLIQSYFLRPAPADAPPAVDAEVAEAAGAVAAVFEARSRGVPRAPQASSAGGRRMAAELQGVLEEAGRGGGVRFDREVADVLRAIERTAAPPAEAPGGQRRYLELVARVFQEGTAEAGQQAPAVLRP
jgi:pyruvate/2-oxoglutarate dehydrogenase complex dihydrolipoamide acyltransferase (E2) component